MWDRAEERAKSREWQGLQVLEDGHELRPGQQAFLDAQDQSYLSSGFKLRSETAQVPRVDRGSWH